MSHYIDVNTGNMFKSPSGNIMKSEKSPKRSSKLHRRTHRAQCCLTLTIGRDAPSLPHQCVLSNCSYVLRTLTICFSCDVLLQKLVGCKHAFLGSVWRPSVLRFRYGGRYYRYGVLSLRCTLQFVVSTTDFLDFTRTWLFRVIVLWCVCVRDVTTTFLGFMTGYHTIAIA